MFIVVFLFSLKPENTTRIKKETGPSDKRIRSFLGRHPGLTEKMAESLDTVRASQSTQDVMESFFRFLRFQLEKHRVLNEPIQVSN